MVEISEIIIIIIITEIGEIIINANSLLKLVHLKDSFSSKLQLKIWNWC